MGHGGSGTTWVAYALRGACGVDARHESMGREPGEDFGGVEVNGRLWNRVPQIRNRFPGTPVVHLVRDGRRVVRSVLSRRPDYTLSEACWGWVRKNREVAGEIPEHLRFRLEGLTSERRAFAGLARVFGAAADRDAWRDLKDRRVNETEHAVPPFAEWDRESRDTFYRYCGPMMTWMGYD